jgi:Phycobilisome degradation protein nblA
MHPGIELTLEQDFSLRSFADLVEQMSLEQAKEFLIEQHRLMMVRETIYRDLIKQHWNQELALPSAQGN